MVSFYCLPRVLSGREEAKKTSRPEFWLRRVGEAFTIENNIRNERTNTRVLPRKRGNINYVRSTRGVNLQQRMSTRLVVRRHFDFRYVTGGKTAHGVLEFFQYVAAERHVVIVRLIRHGSFV